MRFVISCGGTGGHLSPGIALAEGLVARGHEVTLLISRKKVDARLIEKYPHLRFERMSGRGFSWGPIRFGLFAISQARAVKSCLRLITQWQPQVVVGFGGFTSLPAVVAGRLARLPVVLHEANRVPGKAVRFLGRFATRVYVPQGVRVRGVGAAATRQLGLPVRREIVRLGRAESRAALGLDPNQKVLAVLGGSQGAATFNQWARNEAPALAAEGVQLYCLTGIDKGEPEIREFPARGGGTVRAMFVPFSDRMAELMSAADLVVSRAGAGTLAELIRCETPGVLVPFPHAADDHQRANAAFFERQGGGVVVEQHRTATLRAEVLEVIFNDWLLRKFRGNLKRMDRANSLDLMVRDLEAIAGMPSAPSAPTFAPA